MGYDATRLLIAALRCVEGQLAARLQNGPALAGVTGPIVYAAGSRVPVKPVTIYDAARPDRPLLQLNPAAVPAP